MNTKEKRQPAEKKKENFSEEVLDRKGEKWNKHGRSEISRDNVGILFALPVSPLSGDERENVNRHTQEHIHTQVWDLQWWDGAGGHRMPKGLCNSKHQRQISRGSA